MDIEVPVKNVSSCTVGENENGETVLYITTAKRDDGSLSEEAAGGLFVYKL